MHTYKCQKYSERTIITSSLSDNQGVVHDYIYALTYLSLCPFTSLHLFFFFFLNNRATPEISPFPQPAPLPIPPAGELRAAILSAQSAGDRTDLRAGAATADLRGSDLELLAPEDEALDDLRALASQAPVIKLVNVLILEALRARASDIHLESTADGLRVRYRIDGVLHDISRPPRQYQAAVISRIKITANLNIAERRQAQDGRIRLRLSDREMDLRG